MSEGEPNQFLRFLAVTAITIIGATPFAVFMFVMGLVVAESVIYPVATLATAAVGALVAGWVANSLAGDEERTDLRATVVRNLAWAVIPAVASIFLASTLDKSVWLIAIVLAYTSATAAILALRHRTTDATTPGDGQLTVGWLVGTVVAVGMVIFVASLFGLTGA
ncbi:MAG: hypothetical protein ACRDZM_10670 [Acidimicrobiia bacterium]